MMIPTIPTTGEIQKSVMTTVEIQDSLAGMYQAKQALSVLDRQFNAQSAVIMDKARQDVEDLRAAYATQRSVLVDAFAVATKKLEEGK